MHCALGVPFSCLSARHPLLDDAQIAELLQVFAHEQYVLWCTLHPQTPHIAVVLKDGHGSHNHLKAWAHAHEVARLWAGAEAPPHGFGENIEVIRRALEQVSAMFPAFLDGAREAGWKTEESVLVGGSPVTISIGEVIALEEKKDI